MPPSLPVADTTELLTLLGGSAADAGMQLYDRYADRVHDFVLFLTRERGLAAEITRDVIVMTANSQTPFESPEQLRSWLYARARDETFAILGVRGRPPAEDRVIELQPLPAEHTTADLAHVVYEATAAFSERDLALLTLYLRHGLEGAALGEAMGLSENAVELLLPATLERVDAQTTALVALAAGQDHAVDGVVEGEGLSCLRRDWDGTFSPLVRRRAMDLLEELAAVGTAVPSPLELLRQIPPSPAPASLRDAVEERLRLTGSMTFGSASTPLPGTLTDPTVPPDVSDPGVSDPGVSDPGVSDPGVSTSDVSTSDAITSDAIAPVAAGAADAIGTVAPVNPDPVVRPARALRLPPRVPRGLAVGLGVAVALVVAGGIFRVVADGPPTDVEADAVTLATPPSIAEATSPTSTRPPGSTVGPRTAIAPGDRVQPPPATPQAASAFTSVTPRPGVLSVPAGPVDLEEDTPASLRLTNSGGTPVDFQLLDVPAWLIVSRTSGTVDVGEVGEVTLSLAPDLPEGDYRLQLPVRWGAPAGDLLLVDVGGTSERAPVPGAVNVGARAILARGCGLDSTEVAVMITDESPLEEVVVAATPDGQETSIRFRLSADPDRPGRFVGVVGPFDAGGGVSMRVEATDLRGNSVQSDAGRLTIAPCPG